MAATYVHLSGRDIDNAILELNGLKQKEENNGNHLAPITCARCSTLNDASAKFCNKCGMLLACFYLFGHYFFKDWKFFFAE